MVTDHQLCLAPTTLFNIQPSRIFSVFFSTMWCLGFILSTLSPLIWPVKFIFVLGLVVVGRHQWRKRVLLSAPTSPSTLSFSQTGSHVIFNNGERDSVFIRSSSQVWSHLICLDLEGMEADYSIAIFRDSLSQEEFRRLKLLLRTQVLMMGRS